jgi:hypothetical protein
MRRPLDVFLTVDTEASIAGCFANPGRDVPLLEGPVDGTVAGRSEALGFLLRTLTAHGLAATFFTESLQTRYFGSEPMQRRAAEIVAAGQDLQLHVHPCWRNFVDGQVVSTQPADHSTGRPHEELVAIFREAIDHFTAWGFGPPTAVRTGNFSTGLDTFRACSELGLRVSSNVSVALSQPGDAALHFHYHYRRVGDVLEVPLSPLRTRNLRGRPVMRPLTITACSAREVIGALEQAHALGFDMVCMLTHPFEYILKDSYRFDGVRANPTNQGRLLRLCEHIAAHPDKFAMKTFGQLSADAELPTPPQSVTPLRGSVLAMLQRAAENAYTDRFH